MEITDLVEKDDLLCDPNKDFTPYTGKVEGNIKGELIDGMLNGEWVELFESGKIASIIHYDKNKMSGNYKKQIRPRTPRVSCRCCYSE